MEHIARGKRGDKDESFDYIYIKGLLNYLKYLKPTFNKEAEELLINKFVEFTQIQQDDGSLPIQTRQMEGIQRLCEAYAKLTFKDIITVEIVEFIIKFYQKCLCTLGMNVSETISQVDLRGFKLNKDEFFEQVFKDLALNNMDGKVFIHELAEKLLENHKLFSTDTAIETYVEKRKKSGWLFEPNVGVFKRQ